MLCRCTIRPTRSRTVAGYLEVIHEKTHEITLEILNPNEKCYPLTEIDTALCIGSARQNMLELIILNGSLGTPTWLRRAWRSFRPRVHHYSGKLRADTENNFIAGVVSQHNKYESIFDSLLHRVVGETVNAKLQVTVPRSNQLLG
jgi:hypothetical protein